MKKTGIAVLAALLAGCSSPMHLTSVQQQMQQLQLEVRLLRAGIDDLTERLRQRQQQDSLAFLQLREKIQSNLPAAPPQGIPQVSSAPVPEIIEDQSSGKAVDIQPAMSLPSADHRCQAITQKGTRCTRKVKPGSRFCWQHNR